MQQRNERNSGAIVRGKTFQASIEPHIAGEARKPLASLGHVIPCEQEESGVGMFRVVRRHYDESGKHYGEGDEREDHRSNAHDRSRTTNYFGPNTASFV